MLKKQIQHKRVMNLNDILSFTRCYWYAQAISNIVPIGNENDSKRMRPSYDLP
jgi:hypothetical protein